MTKLRRGPVAKGGGGPESCRFIVGSRLVVRLDAVVINKDSCLHYKNIRKLFLF